MQMLDEIRKKYDLSILMTTHDFSMLPRYCDRVVLLAGGKILKKGTPLDVLNSDEFAQRVSPGRWRGMSLWYALCDATRRRVSVR